MILKNLIKVFRNIFSRQKYKKISPEKISYWSKERLSQGFFKFFTPHYIPNGVCLQISDRKGLADYMASKRIAKTYKNLEEKSSLEEPSYFRQESPLDRYSWFGSYNPELQGVNESRLLGYLLNGFRTAEDYLKGLSKTILSGYKNIKLDFSPKYLRQNIFSENSQLNFEFGI